MKPKKRGTVENFEDYKRQKPEVERLRSLVLGEEFQQALETLVSREDDEDRVTDVVSEAITKRSERDASLTHALAPVVDRAIQKSIDENPKRIINVIFPILGPAVRKAVAAALADMVQSLNSVLEQSVNVKSLWWRLQARRAGVPYAHYVLLKTLRFRVEQVLLVHRETGMLLQHVAQPDVEIQDPELVSSMLTAITDFVSDSFSQESSDTLEGVRFGEFNLHIEVGPDAILATAVRGTLGENARVQLSETLEQIHAEYSAPLKQYSGDRSEFSESEMILKTCLVTQTLDDSDKRKIPFAAMVFIVALIGLVSYRLFLEIDRRAEFAELLNRVSGEPGYVIVNHDRSGTEALLTILRDTEAAPLESVTSDLEHLSLAVEFNTTDIVFQPEMRVSSIEDDANEQIETLLGDYDQVNAEADDGVLRLSGVITQESLNNILSNADVDDQYQRIDVSDAQIVSTSEAALTNLAELEAYREVVSRISGLSFYFQLNSLAFAEGSEETLFDVTNAILELEALHETLNLPPVELLIIGFADKQGTDAKNNEISQDRANFVRDLLVSNGVSANLLISWGVGHISGSALSDDAQRRATITVTNDILELTGEEAP